MRMMLRVRMETQAANAGIADGSLPRGLEKVMEVLHPEAAYFGPLDGDRAAYFVFDMTDSWQLPSVLEPLFSQLNAKLDISPVMNADDLKKGLSQLAG